MNTMNQVGQLLDTEHRAHLALLARVEQALVRASRPDATLCGLMAEYARALEADVGRHFGFEEESLFPLLVENGDGGIAALLGEEHEAIREVAGELLPLARAAAGGGIDDAGWTALRRTSMELVERQVAHIQKETMGLLPLLADLLDDETDRELSMAYAAR